MTLYTVVQIACILIGGKTMHHMVASFLVGKGWFVLHVWAIPKYKNSVVVMPVDINAVHSYMVGIAIIFRCNKQELCAHLVSVNNPQSRNCNFKFGMSLIKCLGRRYNHHYSILRDLNWVQNCRWWHQLAL